MGDKHLSAHEIIIMEKRDIDRCIKRCLAFCMAVFLAAILLFVVLWAFPAQARHTHPEKYYQAAWCASHGGRAEVVLPDRTRCDCITSTHAVEVDFAHKWAEGVGQAIHYSRLTGKRGGLVLIIERPSDWQHVRRVKQLRDWLSLPLDVYTVEAEE